MVLQDPSKTNDKKYKWTERERDRIREVMLATTRDARQPHPSCKHTTLQTRCLGQAESGAKKKMSGGGEEIGSSLPFSSSSSYWEGNTR
jgi:hypothetical protein